MKKKFLIGLMCFVFVMGLTGCGDNKTTKETDKTTKTEEKSIKGNCTAIECVKKLKSENTVEEINKVIGFEGKLTDEKYNKYTWEISDDESITATYYSSDKATIEATYDRDSLKNKKVDFSKYDEIQTALKSGNSLTYDEFKEKVGSVDGTLIYISSSSKKYVWVDKNGGYLTGTFSDSTGKCTFVIGRLSK